MKINYAKTIEVEKWVDVGITHKGKEIVFSLITVDGKVEGNEEKGISTFYLNYFHENSKKVRHKHFEKIKNYIERHIK